VVKPDKIIKNVKSIVLSDECDNASSHHDKKGTWSSVTIRLDDGNTIVIQPCNCGALNEKKGED